MNAFEWIISGCIAFIGVAIITSSRYLGKVIGGGLFFLYITHIALPILLLFRFKKFINDPIYFLKAAIVGITERMMED
jgi:hypothetical protein